jgi:predicted small lipoprotein YifL
LRAAALALVLVALLGCGRKGPVKPPELARPAAITDLRAANEEEAVALAWSRPSEYADGARMTDLGEFRVERASGDAPGWDTIAVLPVADRERVRQIKRFRFADRGVAMGEVYRYRVVSSTVDGYASAPSNEAAIVRQPPEAPPAGDEKR